MSVQNKFESVTIVSGANLAGMQYKAVTPAGVIAAESDTAIGLLQEDTISASGRHMRVAYSGLMKGYAGAAISQTDRIKVTTSGWLIAVASGDGGQIGKALEAANSGDLFHFAGNFALGNTVYDQT